MFSQYELRTTDVDAARSFYSEVLGLEFWGSGVCVSKLPERAALLGAPAHWLGHLRASDPEATARQVIELGGQQLGPSQRSASGSGLVLRDPFGVIVAVSSEPVVSRGTLAWAGTSCTPRTTSARLQCTPRCSD